MLQVTVTRVHCCVFSAASITTLMRLCVIGKPSWISQATEGKGVTSVRVRWITRRIHRCRGSQGAGLCTPLARGTTGVWVTSVHTWASPPWKVASFTWDGHSYVIHTGLCVFPCYRSRKRRLWNLVERRTEPSEVRVVVCGFLPW